MSFCGLIKGISPKISILCVRVKINKCSFELFLCLDLLQDMFSLSDQQGQSVQEHCPLTNGASFYRPSFPLSDQQGTSVGPLPLHEQEWPFTGHVFLIGSAGTIALS